MNQEKEALARLSRDIRMRLIRMIHEAGGGHVGGSLSSVDILVTLFFDSMRFDPKLPKDPGRDRFVLSKGHSVEAYYCTLAMAGFFPESVLESYGKFGSILYGHPTMKVPGVEIPSGALGHGLSVGVGMALAGKRDGRSYRTFVLMGDGELAEGSIWEAAMAAAHYRLDNLIAIIDCNSLQISGKVESVMKSSPLPEKWESFGWDVVQCDGHDHSALAIAFDSSVQCKPRVVIARTTKGKGVSFMENDPVWHHKAITEDDFKKAEAELLASTAGGAA